MQPKGQICAIMTKYKHMEICCYVWLRFSIPKIKILSSDTSECAAKISFLKYFLKFGSVALQVWQNISFGCTLCFQFPCEWPVKCATR